MSMALCIEHVPVEVGVFVVGNFMLGLVLSLLKISELLLLFSLVCLLTLGLVHFQKLMHNLFEFIDLNVLEF